MNNEKTSHSFSDYFVGFLATILFQTKIEKMKKARIFPGQVICKISTDEYFMITYCKSNDRQFYLLNIHTKTLYNQPFRLSPKFTVRRLIRMIDSGFWEMVEKDIAMNLVNYMVVEVL